VSQWLNSLNVSNQWDEILKTLVIISIILVLGILVNWMAKGIIAQVLGRLVKRSNTHWDDALYEHEVFHKLSHLAPVLVVYLLGPAAFSEFPTLEKFAYNMAYIYIVVVAWMVLNAFFNAILTIYEGYDISKARPIKGYIQILKILFGFVGIILVLSILLNRSPLYFFTGLGAMTAVLMLIFKDTILGFVGGVQITANNLVQIGDWIEMPKYNADGDVIDITLHTVLVQNWDRTITSIPAYALISESFRNWRGMVQSGGRRIKRSVFIDVKSIKFCDEAMLEKFEKIYLIKDYVKSRKAEIDKYNSEHEFDTAIEANGRRMTNVGTFRVYLFNYLKNHPRINHEMICMVRQLEPTEKGLPMEIYAFTADTAWVNYESIQSDIFDHVLSVAPIFDLQVFQLPTKYTLEMPVLSPADRNKEPDEKIPPA
jgi:miniconductance mechanosensitive channel